MQAVWYALCFCRKLFFDPATNHQNICTGCDNISQKSRAAQCGGRRGERVGMIEIIREENSDTTERHSLPKDIRQMGKPDVGERIYVENEVYQFLHPYGSVQEKRAYVLLGRFENYSGRDCAFVEAAIFLEEIDFDGDLPLWNDETWAYIYRQLRREYDKMVIVGWAVDIKGQLPNMTGRLERMHQSNFGGIHQLLFLMDSLEGEEAFYGNKNGRLCRREGFYVYYEKKAAPQIKKEMLSELGEQEARKAENREMPKPDSWDWRRQNTDHEESVYSENPQPEAPEEYSRNGVMEEVLRRRGSYRSRMTEKETGSRRIPSYASTALLAAVVCTLGITAYLNSEKMRSMEETLAQMNLGQLSVEEQTATGSGEKAVETSAGEKAVETSAGKKTVEVENIAGNVQQENVQSQGQPAAGGADAAQSGAAPGETAPQPDAAVGQENGISQSGGVTENTQAGAPSDGQGTETAGPPADTQNADGPTGNTPPANAGSAPAMTEAQSYLDQGYYIVQKGDSLVGICKRIYQTTALMDKLCEVNGIEDADSIYAGQKLLLPN